MNKNALSEYYKLKMKLCLTFEENAIFKNYEFFVKNRNKFKICKKCRQIKHIDEFYYHPLKKQKCTDLCKTCVRLESKLRRKQKNDKIIR